MRNHRFPSNTKKTEHSGAHYTHKDSVVTCCGDCPCRSDEYNGPSWCSHPSEEVPAEDVTRGGDTLPAACPLPDHPMIEVATVMASTSAKRADKKSG